MTATVFGILILSILVGINKNFTPKEQPSSVIEQTIKDFWESTKNADYPKIAEIVSDKPDDFYKNCSTSKEKVSEDERSNENETYPVIGKNPNKRGEKLEDLKLDSSFKIAIEKFIENKNELTEIKHISQSENEAIVTIDYKGDGYEVFNASMLLYKTEGKWRWDDELNGDGDTLLLLSRGVERQEAE